MTTKDEVRSTVEALSVVDTLKLALEALEETRNALAWFYDSYPQDVTEKGNELLPHVETVLTAIRAALASKSEALAAVPEAHKQSAEIPQSITCPFCESQHVPGWLHDYNMDRGAYGEQPAQPARVPLTCRDEMCACRGGPCVSCPDGEREKELADVRDSRDFYKRRTDELQKAQSQMRDPERTMVCDILANGRLLVPAGGRYSTSSQPSKPWVGLTQKEIQELKEEGIFLANCEAITEVIEAKLKEKNNG